MHEWTNYKYCHNLLNKSAPEGIFTQNNCYNRLNTLKMYRKKRKHSINLNILILFIHWAFCINHLYFLYQYFLHTVKAALSRLYLTNYVHQLFQQFYCKYLYHHFQKPVLFFSLVYLQYAHNVLEMHNNMIYKTPHP